MHDSIVFMGVAGCGKSSIARSVAQEAGFRFIEGDDFHSPQAREKMSQGIALTDADRAQWLVRLGDQIAQSPQGLVLTCSALKKAYRTQLRARAPALKFVYLAIEKPQAQRRVAARASHFFAATLVDSQFATLEPPVSEVGVLWLDATLPQEVLRQQVADWMRRPA